MKARVLFWVEPNVSVDTKQFPVVFISPNGGGFSPNFSIWPLRRKVCCWTSKAWQIPCPQDIPCAESTWPLLSVGDCQLTGTWLRGFTGNLPSFHQRPTWASSHLWFGACWSYRSVDRNLSPSPGSQLLAGLPDLAGTLPAQTRCRHKEQRARKLPGPPTPPRPSPPLGCPLHRSLQQGSAGGAPQALWSRAAGAWVGGRTLVRCSFPPEPLVQMIRCLEKRKHCLSPSFLRDREPSRPRVILPFSDIGTWMREPAEGTGPVTSPWRLIPPGELTRSRATRVRQAVAVPLPLRYHSSTRHLAKEVMVGEASPALPC